jgi:hypothetical protein
VSSLPQQGPEPNPAVNATEELDWAPGIDRSSLDASSSSSGSSGGSGQPLHSDCVAVQCGNGTTAAPSAFGDQYLALCLAIKVRDAVPVVPNSA